MGILKAIGFGLFLIMLKFIVPQVFSGGESLVVSVFETLQLSLTKAQATLNTLP